MSNILYIQKFQTDQVKGGRTTNLVQDSDNPLFDLLACPS